MHSKLDANVELLIRMQSKILYYIALGEKNRFLLVSWADSRDSRKRARIPINSMNLSNKTKQKINGRICEQKK